MAAKSSTNLRLFQLLAQALLIQGTIPFTDLFYEVRGWLQQLFVEISLPLPDSF